MKELNAQLFMLINNMSLRSKWLDLFMISITQLGEGWVILLIMGAIYLLIGGSWYVECFVGIIAAGAVCQVVKRFYPHPRPVSILPKVNIVGRKLRAGSFPSGHTATGFVIATILSYYAPGFSWLLFIIALLIGISRMYVGAHFPKDVFWGAITGTLTSAALMAFKDAAPGLGIQSPLTMVFWLSLAVALTIPLFGGLTIKKMYKGIAGEIEWAKEEIRKFKKLK